VGRVPPTSEIVGTKRIRSPPTFATVVIFDGRASSKPSWRKEARKGMVEAIEGWNCKGGRGMDRRGEGRRPVGRIHPD